MSTDPDHAAILADVLHLAALMALYEKTGEGRGRKD